MSFRARYFIPQRVFCSDVAALCLHNEPALACLGRSRELDLQLSEAEKPVLTGYARTDGVMVEKNARLLYDLGFRVIMVGVDAGQMSRVDAVQIAIRKAGDRANGTALASDAFFPFRDGLEVLADAGVTAVVAPGGSIRDQEVIAAADERQMVFLIAPRRHFRH